MTPVCYCVEIRKLKPGLCFTTVFWRTLNFEVHFPHQIAANTLYQLSERSGSAVPDWSMFHFVRTTLHHQPLPIPAESLGMYPLICLSTVEKWECVYRVKDSFQSSFGSTLVTLGILLLNSYLPHRVKECVTVCTQHLGSRAPAVPHTLLP